MQQQPPYPSSSNLSPAIVTTEQIQKCLEENKNLILAIMEHKNLCNFQECAQYQAILQRNLMNLAAIADTQPPPTPQIPSPSQVMQMTPSLTPQQANNFMQQASGGGSGQKLPFQLNPQQQQLLLFQEQQQLQAQMGLRQGQGGQSGLFGMQSAMTGNHGGEQGGSEAAFGGDGRSFLRDNSGFRDS